jgi:hypothetical protein
VGAQNVPECAIVLYCYVPRVSLEYPGVYMIPSRYFQMHPGYFLIKCTFWSEMGYHDLYDQKHVITKSTWEVPKSTCTLSVVLQGTPGNPLGT